MESGIAYFSDKSGEYELWVRPSDSKPAEEEKKADDKKDKDGKDAEKKSEPDMKAAEEKEAAKKEAERKEAEKKDEKKPEPRMLTSLGAGFRYNPTWSPDSKLTISFTDQAGRLQLTTVETGETKLIDTDPSSSQLNASWSSDSQWMTYGRSDEDSWQGCVWLYNVKTAVKTRVTSPMFSSFAPAFDRKGEFLYFTSNLAVKSGRRTRISIRPTRTRGRGRCSCCR